MSYNKLTVLINGESATGKSSSLKGIKNAVLANCEAGKLLPFKANNIREVVIVNPKQVFEVFTWAEMPEQKDIEYIIIDGLNFLMDMFESIFVLPKAGTKEGMTAWSNYAQYFKELMQQYVAKSTKKVIFTAHTRTVLNETAMVMETKVPIKGALANQGIEAYFTTIVSTKKVAIDDLEGYENDLLHITDRDRKLGYKHVFQTMPTASTTMEKMRAPMDLFSDEETFIDNDAEQLMKRLDEYYA